MADNSLFWTRSSIHDRDVLVTGCSVVGFVRNISKAKDAPKEWWWGLTVSEDIKGFTNTKEDAFELTEKAFESWLVLSGLQFKKKV